MFNINPPSNKFIIVGLLGHYPNLLGCGSICPLTINKEYIRESIWRKVGWENKRQILLYLGKWLSDGRSLWLITRHGKRSVWVGFGSGHSGCGPKRVILNRLKWVKSIGLRVGSAHIFHIKKKIIINANFLERMNQIK